ncbi:MAG: hypothetical protein ABGW88_04070 [Leeuwenhoekiella sp.]|uniref:hypothetical protein n=1 Tax=Leeuwenhoekiella sp. TaxID=1977054 RepID=UPI0032429ED2
MTRKFKRAVKAYVADGVLTQEEIEDLKKLAESEGIEEHEAHIYITSRLKKRKAKLEKPKNGVEKLSSIGETLVAVGGFALTVITFFKKK